MSEVIAFKTMPYIKGWAALAGKKEGEGPLGKSFDMIIEDATAGKNSWESAESTLQKKSIELLLDKMHMKSGDIDAVYAGDLLNQCSGSGFALRESGMAFCGVYGACSTSVLSMINAATAVEAGIMKNVIASTSSHFCSAEKQFRLPLEYGGQRTPTAQWTVTGTGSALISSEGEKGCPRIKSAIIGKVIDKGVTDANNMGAAMAPADVIITPYRKAV